MTQADRPSGFATTQLHAGYVPGTPEYTVVPPVYQSSAYAFSSLTEAREKFALREQGYIYSRNSNPTQAVLEQRLAVLEGGVAAAAVSSGQAAVALTTFALLGRGGHVVASSQLYGGTVDLFGDTFGDFGLEVTFVDQDDFDAWRDAVRPNTRAFFAESVANPIAQVLDVASVAEIAHEAGVPLVIDNTVATPYLLRPRDFGADFVVHSATKFIGGHGSSLGGVVVDLGTFDFSAEPEKWPGLFVPHWRYGDVSLWEAFGPERAFITLVKSKFVGDLGTALSPFNAFQLITGLETLDLRIARHVDNAKTVASFLDRHPAVGVVFHPSIGTNPWKGVARTYLPKGSPSVFAFELVPSEEDAFARVERVVDALRTIRLVANIGDARTIVAHPASMTHNHMTPGQLAAAGISQATIRISVGLEEADDIVADLEQALARA
ncbi:aminotransferase class V-fold PLP-dependent enzyme [Microbacterium betulae]|uniref:Aminotransferase class V-fold PLP-dependent enzyme n=1 Tax=Microbacterium betulae TaxID=2981139 RepID=A0AA97I832_9MICO|nr:aminotransferase class V-fold PLP-dependent enzyme [Microbacterium sp. AB]WOF24257.1 aminotransferase class V-fold PLP-dependent enzyme [Microbacterium sp. AB]